jgi:hypothetical protein
MSQNNPLEHYRWRPGEGSKDWNPRTVLVSIAVLLIPFAICGFSRIIPAIAIVVTQGQIVDGRVAEAQIIDRVSMFDGNDNMSTYRYTWEFVLDDNRRTMTGQQQITYRNTGATSPLRVGDIAPIVYDPADPSISLLQTTYEDPSNAWGWINIGICGGVFLLFMLVIGLFTMRYNMGRMLHDFYYDPEGIQERFSRRT